VDRENREIKTSAARPGLRLDDGDIKVDSLKSELTDILARAQGASSLLLCPPCQQIDH